MFGLTAPQYLQLTAVLRQKAHVGMAEIIIDHGAKIVCDDRKYRLCGYTDVVLRGKDERDCQRFRCRKTEIGECGKTFNGITGTVLALTRQPDQWLNYAQFCRPTYR